MKTFWKVLTALAAIAGAVYVIATYGDKIVAWAKKVLGCCELCACDCDEDYDDCDYDCDCGDECDCDEGCTCQCGPPTKAPQNARDVAAKEAVSEGNCKKSHSAEADGTFFV